MNLLLAAVLRGVFPLLVTPYTEDAKLDIPVLVKEAEFVVAHGADGVIWPTAGEVCDLDGEGEYMAGLEALALRAKSDDFTATLTPVCMGTNAVQALERAGRIEALRKKSGVRMAILARPPDDALTQEEMESYYRALATKVSCPVIVQTYNGKSPQPSVRMLVELAIAYPAIYGHVKEESPGGRALNNRIVKLVDSKPVIKTVFSGWGAKGFLFQGPRLGTRGIITQRPGCTDLLKDVFKRVDAGADVSDPVLADRYAKLLLLFNLGDTFAANGDEMRGPHLYVLQKRGVFRNTFTRKAAKGPEARFGGKWKLETFRVTDDVRREIDARLDFALKDLK